jgi:ABC-type methionine transport system ATPase subunit
MIEVEGLTKVFGSGEAARTALEDVNLRIHRGQIAAIVGPSGAGKSTLARCINLLERPTLGTVRVAGQDLASLRPRALQHARRTIGTIFQASSLLIRRTAAENVSLPLECAGVDRAIRRARVGELLERVGLADHADAYPRQLSGGQRQRVGIARALALRPAILLSDEATSGLDPTTTRSILDLLEHLRAELGLTILLITHEMSVVRAVADHATLIDRGRVIESGLVGELVSDARSPLGRGLLPDREPLGATEGSGTWNITYAGANVPPDWMDRLGRELGVTVALLGGTVETIGGRAAGRVTISVAPRAERVPETLAGWGLHAEAADRQPAWVAA